MPVIILKQTFKMKLKLFTHAVRKCWYQRVSVLKEQIDVLLIMAI